MNEYEITYLANPKLDESAKDKLDEAIDGEITKLGGEISFSSASDAPGSRRRLHFPIKAERVTWVRVVQTKLDPAKLKQLREIVDKHNDILRVTILQTPRREDASAAILQSLDEQQEEPKPAEPAQEEKPAKKVTAKAVEEGIEKALEEEVK